MASATFSGNTVHSDNDIYGVSANGGAIYTYGRVLVANSTFSGNTASASNAFYGAAGNGGAIFVDAGGSAAIPSSTFSGNGASASNNFFGTDGQGGALWGAIGLAKTIARAQRERVELRADVLRPRPASTDGSCGVGAGLTGSSTAGLAATEARTRHRAHTGILAIRRC